MAEEKEYLPIGQPRSSELAAAWVIVILFAAAVALLGYVAWNSWNVSRENRAVLASLDLSGKRNCVSAAPAAETVPAADCARPPLDKPAWKIFSQYPLRLEYPEDYRVSAPMPGRIEVTGAGGRLEIQSAYQAAQDCRAGVSSTQSGAADGSYDLKYAVDMRVQLFYAADAKSYDRSILKDISATVALSK